MNEFENGLSDVQNGLSGNVIVLDNIKQNSPSSNVFLKTDKKFSSMGRLDKKKGLAFHSFVSGCKIAFYRNEFLYFASFTMPSPFAVINYNDFDGYEYELLLNKLFDVMKKRILRVWEIHISYKKVRTNEGNGVIHLVLRSKNSLPVDFFRDWLRENWSEISGAYMISFDKIFGDIRSIAYYMINQYVASQGFVRCSCSDDWIFKGYAREWNNIKKMFLSSYDIDYCISLWNKWLMYCIKPDVRDIEKKIIKKRLALVLKHSSSGVDYNLLNPILPNWWFVDTLGKDILCPADKEYFKGVFAFSNRMWFLGHNDYC